MARNDPPAVGQPGDLAGLIQRLQARTGPPAAAQTLPETCHSRAPPDPGTLADPIERPDPAEARHPELVSHSDTDTRHTCHQCAHLAPRALQCRNAKRAGLALRSEVATLAPELARLPQHCPGFALRA